MLKRISLTLMSIYLALGPIIWFASYSLGTVKRILFFLVIVSFLGCFKPLKIKGLSFLLLTALYVFMSLVMTRSLGEDGLSSFLLGVLEEYFFFVIGFNIAKTTFFNGSKYVGTIVLFPLVGALLTVMNYMVGVPNWTVPGEELRYAELSEFGYEIRALWASGFSWGRNGWGCTLSLVLPLCFILRKKMHTYVAWLIIMSSIFLCGNRNGVLAATLSLALFLVLNRDKANKRSTILLIVLAVALVLTIFGISGIYSTFRLDSSDITAGRSAQYLFIGEIIKEMGFWGLGFKGTNAFFATCGLGDHAFHNAYLNMVFQYGWIMIIFLLPIIVIAIKSIILGLKDKNTVHASMALIIFSGLMLALFEPTVIFGSLGGYAIWWFAFGYLLSVQKNLPDKETYKLSEKHGRIC